MRSPHAATDTAHLPVMDNESRADDLRPRGRTIMRRRLAVGITSERAFADAVNADAPPGTRNIDKGTIGRAERGDASLGTYNRLEMWLDQREAELGITREPLAPAVEPLRLTMHGVFGVEEMILEGPVDRPDELAEAVGKILDRLRRDSPK